MVKKKQCCPTPSVSAQILYDLQAVIASTRRFTLVCRIC
ncbi:unnamed protein product [Anisakis simplex]|uniref:Uncharacterized protein n=1 Tax=Anisakis simplex TaxID=6269 RepID=A0A0M3KKF9_ANISI|nr:unnamed protein product [Anisakis simplex]